MLYLCCWYGVLLNWRDDDLLTDAEAKYKFYLFACYAIVCVYR